MIQATIPAVTEDDVLQGWKEITVETRDGSELKVRVNALPWRASIIASQYAMTDPALATVQVMEHCLSKECAKDEFLNRIIPGHLSWIAVVAFHISNGVSEAKKRMAESSNKNSASLTASPPNAH